MREVEWMAGRLRVKEERKEDDRRWGGLLRGGGEGGMFWDRQ